MSLDRLIILGGGITGLTTALQMRKQFNEIVIVERDEYPTNGNERRFTPQGHHIHVLLARGVSELFRCVSELPHWFDEAGLLESDLTGDIWVAQAGNWLPRRPCGIPTRPCTRPLLEQMLLRALGRYRHISLLDCTKVKAVIGTNSVEGAVLMYKNGETQELRGDLVVDARGRNSQVVQEIEVMGHGLARETVVDAKVAYASCFFKPNTGASLPCSVLAAIGSFGRDPRIGTLMSVGNGQWLATIINYAGSAPPKTVDAFLEQSAALCVPDLHEHLIRAEPSSQVTLNKNTANRRRHFNELKGWPERYVVVGDAACCFNPRFGQGITVATIGARLLADELTAHLAARTTLDGFSRRFQLALDKQLESPWQMATMEDKGWIALQRGRISLTDKMRIALSRRLLETMAADYDTYIRVNRVAHMLHPIGTLLSPRTLAKFLLPQARRLS